MKQISKGKYFMLKALQRQAQYPDIVEISDEEYEELQQYVHKPIIIIDNPESDPEPTNPEQEAQEETYTITFKNGYEIVKTVTGAPGTYVSAPNVTKNGYKFDGWSIDGTTVTMSVNIISDSNITYIAIWTKQEEPEEETYDYSGCDFGVRQWGYNIISLEDRTVYIRKYCGIDNTLLIEAIIPETVEYNNILFSVTSISGGAFADCTRLTSVIIPDSVTSIGTDAFNKCRSLTSIDIPDSVTSIGQSTFQNCNSLTSVTIGSGVRSISDGAFEYCYSLTSVTIPDSVTSIGDYAFNKCSSLTSIDIPDSVTRIGMSAFQGCSGLTNCTIGSGVTSIDDFAFAGCSNLISIVIPNSVTSIGSCAFNVCSRLTSITIYSDDIFKLNIDHQITIYVLPELANDYKSYYEKDIFLDKVNILPIG